MLLVPRKKRLPLHHFLTVSNSGCRHPLVTGKIYTVSVKQLSDCSGNEIGLQNECKTGLPEKVKPGDIIFNEILFNPPPYGYDYLELYNRSSGIINCSELWLAARELTGNLKDPVNLVKEERAFFPGEYLLLTENPDWVLHHYPNTDESTHDSAEFYAFPSG